MAEVPKSYRAGDGTAGSGPSLVQVKYANQSSSTSMPRPVFTSATTPGNCLVLIDAMQNNVADGNISAASGWTKAGTYHYHNQTNITLAVFVQPDTAQAATQPTLAGTTSSNNIHTATLFEVSGVATSSVVDQLAFNGNYTQYVNTIDVATPAVGSEMTGMALAVVSAYQAEAISSSATGGWTYQSAGSYSASISYPRIDTWTKSILGSERTSFGTTSSTVGSTSYPPTAALLTLKGVPSGASGQTVLTVPANKRFIIRSVEMANGTTSSGVCLLYVNDAGHVIMPSVRIAAGSLALETCYTVLDAGDVLYSTVTPGVTLLVSGIEVDV